MAPDEALAWWYARIDFERRTPQPGDLKLDRMRAVLRAVGDPHRRLRVVHVAGSKGKGSVAAMLAAVLRAAGYRTGLFTSPHLTHVRERIQVDGEPVSPAELAALLTDLRDALGPRLAPTFFEVGTAAGLMHFVRRRVGVAVLEVGLGGRFDATNVVTPSAAVITSISHDHTQLLGDRLAQIAFEKAGIVKPGRPTVSGATAPEARAVIEGICRQRGSPLTELGRDFDFRCEPGRVTADDLARPRVTVTTAARRWPAMELGLLGTHQAANAAVAVAVVERLREAGLTVADAAVAAGLAGVRWPARLEVIGRRPLVLLDCAHNTASAQALTDTLAQSFPPGRRLLVFAVSDDKDVPGMLRLLAPHFDHFVLTRFANPRAVPPERLADGLRALSVADTALTLEPDPAAAWRAARALAGPGDLVVVTGSVFLAGELRPVLVGAAAGEPR
jgi:dihydrofolate synthase/folylpolyglutamate synthase